MKIEAGQWWQTRHAGKAHIRYVAPESMDYPVFAVLRDNNKCYSEIYCLNGKYYSTTSGSGYDLMTHLPECTGWDWQPPEPVDPGTVPTDWKLIGGVPGGMLYFKPTEGV